MIPHILNFVWIGSEVPPWVAHNLDHWRQLNPNFEFRLRGEGCLDDRYQKAYHFAKSGISSSRKDHPDLCTLSDLIRLSALRKEGGWYIDCDFVPLRPWEDLYRDYQLLPGCFLTQQWMEGPKRINNGIIGITKDSPAWAWIDQYVDDVCKDPSTIQRTSFGPLMASRLVTEVPEVTVGQVQDFYSIRFNPKGQAKKVLQQLEETGFSQETLTQIWGRSLPYAFHLWAGGDYSDMGEGLPEVPQQEEPPPPPTVSIEEAIQRLVIVTVAREGEHRRGEIIRFAEETADRLPKIPVYVLSDLETGPLPMRVVKLNHPEWPAWATKLEAFRSDMPWGPGKHVLYMDPRIEIVGNILPLICSQEPFAMMCGLRKKDRRSTGVLSWTGDWSELYSTFVVSPSDPPSDGDWIASRTNPVIIQNILGDGATIQMRKGK